MLPALSTSKLCFRLTNDWPLLCVCNGEKGSLDNRAAVYSLPVEIKYLSDTCEVLVLRRRQYLSSEDINMPLK
jgi:hypothetical protein